MWLFGAFALDAPTVLYVSASCIEPPLKVRPPPPTVSVEAAEDCSAAASSAMDSSVGVRAMGRKGSVGGWVVPSSTPVEDLKREERGRG
jgi:hypothetical protein